MPKEELVETQLSTTTEVDEEVAEEVAAVTPDEQKLLDILGADEIPDIESDERTREIVADAFPDMDDHQIDLMSRVIQARMPTPEEIAEAEQIARHNAGVSQAREERLAARAAKRKQRAKIGRRKR
jgi:hypothetical protein